MEYEYNLNTINADNGKAFTSPDGIVLTFCTMLNVKLNTEQAFKLSLLFRECYNAGYLEGMKKVN